MTNDKCDLSLEEWEEILDKKVKKVIDAMKYAVHNHLLSEGLDIGLIMDISVAKTDAVVDESGKSRTAVGGSSFYFGPVGALKLGLKNLTELIQKEYPDS